MAAVSRLAESAWVFRLGLTRFRFLGRVLPELAGLGRMKANSKVPPIARVCGQSRLLGTRRCPNGQKVSLQVAMSILSYLAAMLGHLKAYNYAHIA